MGELTGALKPRCKPDTWGTRRRVNSTAWGTRLKDERGTRKRNWSSRKEVWTTEDK